jgi:small nuclear ribonucleoprotein D3
MSVTGKRGIGIPTILLHDTEGTIVTIELKNGETFRGLLDESEDNMNCIMKNVTKTDTNGNVSQLELCYLRGSQILMIIIPDMLKKAPMFKRMTVWKKYKGAIPALGQGDALEGGAGGPRGQAAAIIRKG